MSATTPIFQSGKEVFKADSCAVVREAVARKEMGLVGLGKMPSYLGRCIEDHQLPGINSMGCWNAEVDQTWKLDWHRNEGIEFTLLDQGNVFFGVGDEKFQLEPCQLTVTRPWQKHTVGHPVITASRLHWIIIDVGVRQPHTDWKWPDWIILSEEELKDLTNILRGNETPVWQSTPEINQVFLKMKQVMDKFDPNTFETKIKLHVNEFLFYAHQLFQTSSKPLNPVLSQAERTVKIFLKNDLLQQISRDWSLEDMAKHCYMGRTQFSNHCLKITNYTPLKYLLKCRIERAVQLLLNTDLSVTEIAFQNGFNSSQYFATQFKKHKGATPQEYRYNQPIPA